MFFIRIAIFHACILHNPSVSGIISVVGASGSGKTTLLNLIATIDRPTNGTIRISGQNIVDIPEEAAAEFRRRHLGFVFQEYNLLETLTIYENIALALTMKAVSKESIRPMIQNVSSLLINLLVYNKIERID